MGGGGGGDWPGLRNIEGGGEWADLSELLEWHRVWGLIKMSAVTATTIYLPVPAVPYLLLK